MWSSYKELLNSCVAALRACTLEVKFRALFIVFDCTKFFSTSLVLFCILMKRILWWNRGWKCLALASLVRFTSADLQVGTGLTVDVPGTRDLNSYMRVKENKITAQKPKCVHAHFVEVCSRE